MQVYGAAILDCQVSGLFPECWRRVITLSVWWARPPAGLSRLLSLTTYPTLTRGDGNVVLRYLSQAPTSVAFFCLVRDRKCYPVSNSSMSGIGCHFPPLFTPVRFLCYNESN